MKVAEFLIDVAMIALALVVGVGYAVLSIVRYFRARPAPEPTRRELPEWTADPTAYFHEFLDITDRLPRRFHSRMARYIREAERTPYL